MDHFRYCVDLVGLDHVAFGPDTLYGDHVALHPIFAHLPSLSAFRGPAFDPVAYVDGLENPTENFANICGWLVQHGFSDDEIRAVLGGNIYRAPQSIWVSPKRAGRARVTNQGAAMIVTINDNDLNVEVLGDGALRC